MMKDKSRVLRVVLILADIAFAVYTKRRKKNKP